MKRACVIIANIVFMLITICLAYGFDNEDTHRRLTDNAINLSRLNNMLKEKIGYPAGLASAIAYKEGVSTAPVTVLIPELIQWGSYAEDVPNCRAQNHFHNPLLPWYLSGMGDPFLPISMYCTTQTPSYIPYYSNITWATGYTIPGSIDKRTTGNIWDWDHTRYNYYYALIASNEADKGQYLANTFKGVGYILHLLQDMAVPAHVRNDFTGHLEFPVVNWPPVKEGFEYFVKNNPSKIPAPNQVTAVNITNSSYTNFWDSDLYDGTNPDVTAYQGGLAEYTNANFLSKSTMFTDELNAGDDHYFPYPRGQNAILWKDPTNKKMYYGKPGDGEAVDHLATPSSILPYRVKYFPQYHGILPVWLDDKCYEEYASKLLPKAVGFSAGLLNHFFRGSIDITPPDQYVYSIIDGSQDPQQFTKIKVKIRNTTFNESMLRGTLIAIAKYKKRNDYKPDLSVDPPGLSSLASEFSYAISSPIGIESLSSTIPQEFIFNFNNLLTIPAGVTDLSLQVVFKGTLGNEKDNAIAVGYKDLMEPTHLVFWNLTDRFALYISADSQYHLYTEGQIEGNTDLASLVDLNDNKILNEQNEPFISQYDITYDIAFMGSSSAAASAKPSAHVTLQPGNYARLIVLADNPTNASQRSVNYLKLTSTDARDGSSDSIMTFSGAYNQDTVKQDTGEVIFNYTDIETFRTIRQHFSTGILRCYPMAYNSEGKPTCPYNESEVMTPSGLAPTPAVLLNKDGTPVSD